jgi:bifunctional non-homologous end joining protein LigD
MQVVVQESGGLEKTRYASLWFKEGSSDKVYNVVIEEVQGSGMYVVNFSYGRRGNSLQTGTKTNEPVSFSEAEKIFNKLVGEKTKKGYRISASNTSTSIQVIAPTEEVPVSKCVLLNPIDESQAEELINDDDWVMQEKMDGVRYMIEIKRDENFDPSGQTARQLSLTN